MSALGRRYGRALLDLANEQGLTQQVMRDIGALSDVWKASSDFRDIVRNPVVPKPALQATLGAIMDKLQTSKLVRNTIGLLTDRGRIPHLPEVLAAFEELSEAESGRVRAEVISAKPLAEAYYSRLQEHLQRATGQQIVLVRREDPSLIGGVVTRIGDRVFDGSISNRLKELRETLLANGETP